MRPFFLQTHTNCGRARTAPYGRSRCSWRSRDNMDLRRFAGSDALRADRKPPGGGSTVWSRAPFGTSNQRCLHVNGTATPTAVLGRTCRVRLPRQRIQHSRPLPLCYALARTTRKIPRLGTRLKAKVRLAAAVCLLTAVALELSAGWTRAAKLTRTQGRPHGPASPPRSGINQVYATIFHV